MLKAAWHASGARCERTMAFSLSSTTSFRALVSVTFQVRSSFGTASANAATVCLLSKMNLRSPVRCVACRCEEVKVISWRTRVKAQCFAKQA